MSSVTHFGHKTRFIVLVLATACLTVVMSNSLAFSFTIICMDDVAGGNTTDHWLHSSTQRNALFSAVAVGSILGTLPLMSLLQYIGMRKTMLLYGLSSGVATILFPLAAESDFLVILAARVVQGFAFGILFSATGAIATTWSPLQETGTYIAMLSAHVQLCSIITMPLAGFLCETSQWRALYYGQGVVTFLLYALFYWFYRDHPKIHRHVSSKELSRISKNRPEVQDRQPVPYLAVCTHKSILGTWLSCTGGCFGFLMLLYYGPSYMNKALGLDVQSTGFATALPYVLAAGVKFISGPLYDKSTFLSERARILFFAVVSQNIMAACFIVISFTESALIAQIAYTAAITFSGLNIVGAIKCAQVVAQQHVHFVMAVISMLSCVVTLAIPAFVSILVPDETAEQWASLFFRLAFVLILTNLPFIYLAESEPAEWTKPNWRRKVSEVVKEDAVKTVA